jgi:hypothetical protein
VLAHSWRQEGVVDNYERRPAQRGRRTLDARFIVSVVLSGAAPVGALCISSLACRQGQATLQTPCTLKVIGLPLPVREQVRGSSLQADVKCNMGNLSECQAWEAGIHIAEAVFRARSEDRQHDHLRDSCHDDGRAVLGHAMAIALIHFERRGFTMLDFS